MIERHLALTGCPIFDGQMFHAQSALLIDNAAISGLVAQDLIPAGYDIETLSGGFLAPGFVDLQVNGGGGVLFNETPTADGIAQICAAHLRFGTTALLPTLISDAPAKTAAAIAAVRSAAEVAGCIGLHLEGPHIGQSRQGAHDAAFIRPMSVQDIEQIAGARLDTLLVTLAPESASDGQIRTLVDAGVIVSLGHSDCTFASAYSAFSSGASVVTHLFNAMSPLGHRAPGLVGAVLECGNVHASIIADGHHVDASAIAIALRAKKGPGKLFLISDAMPSVGSDLESFWLAGRKVIRDNGRLALEDGTLAGADLTILAALKFMVQQVGITLDEALRMATSYPAQAVGRGQEVGSLAAGTRADIVHCSDGLELLGLWKLGKAIELT